MNRTYTETDCGICGKVEQREGSQYAPPVGWARLDLVYRLEGSGWTNNIPFQVELCPKCADKVKALLIGEQ